MNIDVIILEKEKGVFVVQVAGYADTKTYKILEEKVEPLLNKSTRAIILDFKDLDYISSMGLRVVFKVKQELVNNGATIAITNLKPQVKKVFEAIKVLPEYYFSTMQEAEKYLDEFLADVQQKEIDKQQENN